MPSIYYFNRANFEQSILGAVLHDLYRDGFKFYSQQQPNKIKFVQGQNVVENEIQFVLKFANLTCQKKYFGRNSREEAIISMVNGVIKDIRLDVLNFDKNVKKIEYLNSFWQSPLNSWFKRNFFSCHLHIFVLSFQIQEINQEIVATYNIFTDIRTLFLESFSFRQFLPLFTRNTRYQNYELYPEIGIKSNRGSFLTRSMLANNSELDTLEEIHIQRQITQENEVNTIIPGQELQLPITSLVIEDNQVKQSQQIKVQQVLNKFQQKQFIKDDKNYNNEIKQIQIQKSQNIFEPQSLLQVKHEKKIAQVLNQRYSSPHNINEMLEQYTPIKLLAGSQVQQQKLQHILSQQLVKNENITVSHQHQNSIVHKNAGPKSQMKKANRRSQKQVTDKPQSCSICAIF